MHARPRRLRGERVGCCESLSATLARRLPVEGLMWTVVEVVVQPRRDRGTQLVGALPVAEPDELLLERADEALDDGVAGRTRNGRERVRELPARAERLAVRAGVLRAVIGAQLDALGHVLRAAERVDELRFEDRKSTRLNSS